MNTLNIKPDLGDTIHHTAEVAIRTLRRRSPAVDVVSFDFNGVLLNVTLGSTIDSVVGEYYKGLKNKPKHVPTEHERKAQEEHLQTLQNQVDDLFWQIRYAVNYANVEDKKHRLLVKSLAELAEVVDNHGVVWDKVELLTLLKNAGYHRKANVKNPYISTNCVVYVHWYVGQIIDMLEGEMGLIHPGLAANFAEQYETLFVRNAK